MKLAKKSGEVLRGIIMGALLIIVMAELYQMDSSAAVFRYQGF